MIKPLSAAIACILMASASAAYAQDAAQAPAQDDTKKDTTATNLDGVIVTGTRAPKAIDKIPGAITVVSQQEVQHTLAVTEDATAVLSRSVPGYAESSQAMSNTGETLRGRLPLRLFDGVPQGSPLREGTRNGTFTDMGIISRVEVINGPSASEGIGATGGVINYISKTPDVEGYETTLTTRYSTQGHEDSEGWKIGGVFTAKQQNWDFIGAASYIDRGITYDGNGRRIGMNTSGSLASSEARNLFLKGGFNFGEDGVQRLQLSYSKFKIEGKGEYIQVLGCRGPTDNPPCDVPRTNTSEKGQIFGSKDAFNDFEQYQVEYSHQDLFGGTLVLNAYKADQAMRYLPENSDDKQLIKVPPYPPGFVAIYDQSEIDSRKKGLRTSWTRTSLFNVDGLELHVGVDLVEDEAEQRLALTDRTWVPPMKYTSTAPYAQLSYDIGPVTLSGGYRREDGELEVDDYTTTAFRNSVFVKGGKLDYKADLTNAGVVWRITDGWSAFAAYSKGFTLPNVGIPLRNISVPNQTVAGILDLQPIIVSNNEAGVNWRGRHGSFAGSVYRSYSELGVSLQIDPTTNDFIMTRAPVEIKGFELSGEIIFNDNWKANALYSEIRGKTSFWSADRDGRFGPGPLHKPMGVLDINPDKLAMSVTWKFLPNADATFGFTRLSDRDLYGKDVRPYDNAKFSYTEKTEGYTLYDASVNYDAGKIGKFTLGIENVFDKQYILSWSQLAGFQNYWAGRGRMTSLTYTIKF